MLFSKIDVPYLYDDIKILDFITTTGTTKILYRLLVNIIFHNKFNDLVLIDKHKIAASGNKVHLHLPHSPFYRSDWLYIACLKKEKKPIRRFK